MIREIYIQTLEQLMMKFSYVSQLEGYSLRYKTQGRQQKPWWKFAKFLRREWKRERKKNPLNANLQPNQRLQSLYTENVNLFCCCFELNLTLHVSDGAFWRIGWRLNSENVSLQPSGTTLNLNALLQLIGMRYAWKIPLLHLTSTPHPFPKSRDGFSDTSEVLARLWKSAPTQAGEQISAGRLLQCFTDATDVYICCWSSQSLSLFHTVRLLPLDQ